jgi:hypothetical protein
MIREVIPRVGAVRGAFVSWAPDGAVPEAALDPPVRALVAALNRTGWARTVFSCGGHPEEPDSVERGRRQAHVDVVVSDPARWRRLAGACGREARRAVRGLDGAGRSGARLRCVEGPLGDVPGWLRAAVEQHERSGGPAGPGRPAAAPAPWWRRLLDGARRGAPPAGAGRWHYRRLALEPAPYAMPPERCRRVLDAALAAAASAADRG